MPSISSAVFLAASAARIDFVIIIALLVLFGFMLQKFKINHAHIDLRFVLASLGLKGGLKACELKLGKDRGDLQDIDGLFAVVRWKAFSGNKGVIDWLTHSLEDYMD